MRFLSARACTRFLTRSLLREKAHAPARAPARKARAGTRTQNGRYSTRIAYDNTRERLPLAVGYSFPWKTCWRSKIGVGVAIGIGIERKLNGIRTRETGGVSRSHRVWWGPRHREARL